MPAQRWVRCGFSIRKLLLSYRVSRQCAPNVATCCILSKCMLKSNASRDTDRRREMRIWGRQVRKGWPLPGERTSEEELALGGACDSEHGQEDPMHRQSSNDLGDPLGREKWQHLVNRSLSWPKAHLCVCVGWGGMFLSMSERWRRKRWTLTGHRSWVWGITTALLIFYPLFLPRPSEVGNMVVAVVSSSVLAQDYKINTSNR